MTSQAMVMGRTIYRRPTLWLVLLTFVATLSFSFTASAAGLLLRNVNGVLQDGGRFDGNVRINSFDAQRVGNAVIVTVTGFLNGTATAADGSVQEVRERFRTTATLDRVGAHGVPRNACQILDLDIGAIHLDLLGLVIDLSPIHLDIVAIPGGGLLGDLLCALANLLDGVPLLDELLRLIRRINDVLAGL